MVTADQAHADVAEARRAHFVRRLPKIELHAHLNGSIRRSTLRQLSVAKGIDHNHALILTKTPKTLSDCFDVFRIIHSCVTTLEDVKRLAYELGQDLEEDGVVYAEIRTTPRAMGPRQDAELEEQGFDEYVTAVLSGFSRFAKETTPRQPKVVLRLLLSIDRAKHSSAQAQTIVDLAHRYHSSGVVGIDLSGDPTKGEWAEFEPALARARSLGLKITLRAGEVSDTDLEMSCMLDFHPDRFGHCCLVSPANLARLTASKTPIELCLTSNLLSNSVAELKDHRFGLHYTHVPFHPGGDEEGSTICCISTDDNGVFGSALSNEYRLVMETFALTEEETFHLARRTVRATFLDPAKSETDRRDMEFIQSRFNDFERSWDWPSGARGSTTL